VSAQADTWREAPEEGDSNRLNSYIASTKLRQEASLPIRGSGGHSCGVCTRASPTHSSFPQIGGSGRKTNLSIAQAASLYLTRSQQLPNR